MFKYQKKLFKFILIGLLSVIYVVSVAQKNVEYLISSSHDSTLIDTSSFQKNELQILDKTKYYWLKVRLTNSESFDQTYILYSSTKWGEVEIFRENSLPVWGDGSYRGIKSRVITGSLLPLHARSYPRSVTAFKVILEKYKIQTYYLRLKGNLSIYTPKSIDLKINKLEDFEQQDKKRFWLQAIFIGIIVIMALYNFVIYLSVRDISYLYYVVSILGIGLYFFFYYGFGIELLWKNSPKWDTFAFSFIIPITNLARIYFTKSYLHLNETSPLLDKSLNIFSAFCLFIFLLATGCYFANIDFLDLLVDLIGFIGTAVLSMMLLCGLIISQKGYRPARYFSLANLILVLGGILFIIRELGWISDNTLTRYAVQYGVIAQVVLFSLGLSSRLNQAQVKVAQLELEKERERKQLLEGQSELLKQKVMEQTADLRELNHLKDKLLSIISHDLRNPLVSLDSFLNLLINHHNRLSEQEQMTLAEKAKQSLGNLNQLLSNLLQWSRSQMNQVKFTPKSIFLLPIVENCLKLHALDAEMKQITISIDIAVDTKFFADEEMLEFIIRNILGNAIKFCNERGEINIFSKNEDKFLIINVLDNGVGVTNEQIEQILTQKIMTSTRGTAKEKGSGLGLAICKEFVEKHDGKLLIEHREEGGTKVSLVFKN